MFRHLFGFVLSAAIAILSACSTAKPTQDAVSPGNLIIYYSPDSGNRDLLDAAGRYGSKVIYVYQNINGIAVTVPAGKDVDDAIKYYESIPGVLSVARDRMLQLN